MEGADLIKLAVELPLAAVVIYAIRELKPVLKAYLDQQLAQLKELTTLVGEVVEGQKTLSAGQAALSEGLQTLGERLEQVEDKVDELVEASESHHA